MPRLTSYAAARGYVMSRHASQQTEGRKAMRRLIQLSLCAVMGSMFVMSAATAGSTAAANEKTRTVWPAENLSGTIMMVDPTLNLVVVQGADKVPFDMHVDRSTRIRMGDKTLTLQDLTQDKNHSVSVRFVPTASGDIARTVQIEG